MDFSPLYTLYNTAPQTKAHFHMIYLQKPPAPDWELVGEQRTTFHFQMMKFPLTLPPVTTAKDGTDRHDTAV